MPPLEERLDDRLTIVRPRVLSPGRVQGVAALNHARVGAAVRPRLDRVRPVILWLSHPDQASQIGRYGEQIVCFDLMDNHGAFKSGAARTQMARAEQRLLRRVDLVFTTSSELQARALAAGARTVLVPNAVEYDLFATAATQPLPAPRRLARLPRPRLLFYGTLGPWVDTGWLAAVARSRPEWSIVVIGPAAGADLAPLDGLPNMHQLGRQPYDSLPAFLQQADVCLLPFAVDDLTSAVDPVKVYEYLAAGKPVVATPLPELAKFGDLVDIAATAEEAVAAVERHNRVPEDEARRRIRLAFAARHTWEARGAIIGAAIEAALAERRGEAGPSGSDGRGDGTQAAVAIADVAP